MGKKESSSKQKEEKQPAAPLEAAILDYQGDKYAVVPMAAQWAKVLRRREENRHLTANELLDLALKEVLGGQVDWKDIQKALANGDAQALNGISDSAKT